MLSSCICNLWFLSLADAALENELSLFKVSEIFPLFLKYCILRNYGIQYDINLYQKILLIYCNKFSYLRWHICHKSIIINLWNDKSTNVVLPNYLEKLTPNSTKSYRCEFSFYLCSCLLTQFLYRTAVKATFHVKDNISNVINNSITLTINITTFPTKVRIIRWQNHICSLSFPLFIIL